MSWEDQDIDDLFRSSGSGKVPPFNDAYWAEMEGLLPDDGAGIDEVFVNAASKTVVPPYQDAYWEEMAGLLPRKKRRIVAFWWYGAAGVASFIIGFFVLRNVADQSVSDQSPNRIESAGLHHHHNLKSQSIPQTAAENSQFTSEIDDQKAEDDFLSYFLDSLKQNPWRNDLVGSWYSESFNFQPLKKAVTVDSLEKLKTGVSYNMARAPFVVPDSDRNEKNFYVQAGSGLGQSFVRNSPGSEMISFYTLGAGLQQQIGKMYVSAGINGRVDFINNLHTSSFVNGGLNESDLKQLYAIETPMVLTFVAGKNRIGGIVTPGFQMGYTGTYISYDTEQNITSRGRTSGKMPQSRTLTMEIGAVYMRSFSDKWSGGCKIATDIVRPIGENNFSGESRLLPLNGSVFIQRNF